MPLKFSAMNLLPKLRADMSNGLLDISTWIRLSTWSSTTYFLSIPYLVYDDCIRIDFVAKILGLSWIPFFSPCPAPPISKLWHFWLWNILIFPFPFAAKLLKRVAQINFSSIITCIHFCETWVFTIVLKLLSSKSPWSILRPHIDRSSAFDIVDYIPLLDILHSFVFQYITWSWFSL